MADDTQGITPADLHDDDLRRELRHLHETRHATVLHSSQSALETHTERMLTLEREFVRRLPLEKAPDPARTPGSSRDHAGQETPGRDVSAGPLSSNPWRRG